MSLFSTVVQTLLNNWTALQLAVDHQLGGKQSKEIAIWMATVLEKLFQENDNVIAEEVTEYLEEIMNNEFNTLCEDGSTDEIGESMCRYYQMIKNGNEADVIKELQKFKGCSIQQCKSSSPKEDKDMEDQDSEDINPESTGITHVEKEKPRKSIKNEPDEDGWVTVSKGKKK